MAIIQIPDDEAVAANVARRSKLRDVGAGAEWEDEPIVGEIVSRSKDNRSIRLINGCTTLAGIRKLTIIGHGSSSGFLIGPHHTGHDAPGDPIMASDMAAMLIKAGYVNGYSIDVIGCFSDYFAMKLSIALSTVYVKGYTDPVSIEQGLPMYPIGGSKPGKAVIQPHPRGAAEGSKGKYRYLNGQQVASAKTLAT